MYSFMNYMQYGVVHLIVAILIPLLIFAAIYTFIFEIKETDKTMYCNFKRRYFYWIRGERSWASMIYLAIALILAVMFF